MKWMRKIRWQKRKHVFLSIHDSAEAHNTIIKSVENIFFQIYFVYALSYRDFLEVKKATFNWWMEQKR